MNFILQNPVVNEKTLGFTLRSPFNLVLKLSKYPIGLPLLDVFRTPAWSSTLGDLRNIEFLRRFLPEFSDSR